jgi:hypothetical protein
MDLPETDLQAYLERLSKRSRDIAVDFVRGELRTGLSSCHFIRHAQFLSDKKKAWHLECARKALQHAEAAMWKIKMTHPEFDQMMALAERLHFELDAIDDKQTEG